MSTHLDGRSNTCISCYLLPWPQLLSNRFLPSIFLISKRSFRRKVDKMSTHIDGRSNICISCYLFALTSVPVAFLPPIFSVLKRSFRRKVDKMSTPAPKPAASPKPKPKAKAKPAAKKGKERQYGKKKIRDCLSYVEYGNCFPWRSDPDPVNLVPDPPEPSIS